MGGLVTAAASPVAVVTGAAVGLAGVGFIGLGLWARREAGRTLEREQIVRGGENGRPSSAVTTAPGARAMAEFIRTNTLEAVSFMVGCATQEEIDYYWDSLSAVPEAEQCGWLKDTFGVSWQITPSILGELLRGGTKEQTARVTEAFLQMKKFDIAELKSAYEGAEARAGGER